MLSEGPKPRHLEAFFLKRKQDKLFKLTNFTKRFFVYDLDQGAIIYYSSQTDSKPSDIIPLSQVVDVRKEDGKLVV